MNTVYYVAFIVPCLVVVPLVVALCINENPRLVGFFKSCLTLPIVCSMVVISVIWKWLYNLNYGPINLLLQLVGIPPIDFLGNPSTVIISLAVMILWQAIGFYMFMFLAGLASIPRDLYDAAHIDGANKWNRFRYITLPQLAPTLVFVVTMAIIWNFQMFDPVYVLTGGGPSYSSYTIVFYIYKLAFRHLDVGYACALSTVLFAIIFAVSMISIRTLMREVT
jgi:ABC-type sugar transport system permease subunit